jgi:aryl-alcohol dehydrogenase-like predicted oxidoreductase
LLIQGTSLPASRLGLGTHSLHRLHSSTARQNLLARAHDLGLTYFDTAPSYGDGIAERELGLFAHERRSQVVLTTKFGIPASRLGATLPGWMYLAMAVRALRRRVRRHGFARQPAREYSAAGARASVEGSLRALRTDHVDILYLHEPALHLLRDCESLVRSLEALKASGKVRYIGLSGQDTECAQLAQAQPRLAEVLQIQVPADSAGLPAPGGPQPQAAAVNFWEFTAFGRAGEVPGRLEKLTGRLLARAPRGVLLLSTQLETQLRETVAMIEIMASTGAASATSFLA